MKTEQTKVTKFVIIRKKWLHGEGSDKSLLLRYRDKKMCCLGFYCESLGYKKRELSGNFEPGGLRHTDRVPKWLIRRDSVSAPSGDALKLFAVNDDTTLKDDVRETRIKKLFAKHGVEVVFEGKY